MGPKKKGKKLLLVTASVISLAALGTGVWFGTRGSGEPVHVYPFQYIGMTEFWGDAQESYGPVSTDKIQTEFLSDTQTVTEVKVKDGDMVKKGDVLFSFDTTLDALSLERKRLEVEKIKVQIDAAGERLQDTREMVPYVPPEIKEPEEEDLGKELKNTYEISEEIGKDKKEYDGKSKKTALICWMKEGTSISDAILQNLFEKAADYQKTTLTKPENDAEKQPESSASEVPENETQNTALLAENNTEPETFPITIRYHCDGKEVWDETVEIGSDEFTILNAYKHANKTYWLDNAVQKMDDKQTRPLASLTISPYPEDATLQKDWKEKWVKDIDLYYMRSVSLDAYFEKENEFAELTEDQEVSLQLGEKAVFLFTTKMDKAPEGTTYAFEVSPGNGMLTASYENDFLILSGTPEEITQSSIPHTVKVRYKFQDNLEKDEWWVDEEISFQVNVVAEPQTKVGEFYVVFKTTQDNYLKGAPTLWQGAKVTAYDNDTFDMQLYNPYEVPGFIDHTIEPEPELEIDLPEINPNEMYTAEQILDMQKQCYAIIKEQNEKLKLAESEYQIMQRELGDGNIYAEIDGKVVGLLTEEEARERKEPLLKVSGGGGFYIEGSVIELEREKLKIGQEVTINDWRNGGTYTGEVVSIGDFPSDSDNWNGMGNPTASYYPFKAFVSEEADLQAGSFVSMTYSTASAEQGIYLEKPFVRTEKGNSYIYVRGADGRLEKRDVKVGRQLWGSYYEILSSLGEEDFLAFPYGKHVKPGAPTVESDLSTLYGF